MIERHSELQQYLSPRRKYRPDRKVPWAGTTKWNGHETTRLSASLTSHADSCASPRPAMQADSNPSPPLDEKRLLTRSERLPVREFGLHDHCGFSGHAASRSRGANYAASSERCPAAVCCAVSTGASAGNKVVRPSARSSASMQIGSCDWPAPSQRIAIALAIGMAAR